MNQDQENQFYIHLIMKVRCFLLLYFFKMNLLLNYLKNYIEQKYNYNSSMTC